jgi:hypothetical protein
MMHYTPIFEILPHKRRSKELTIPIAGSKVFANFHFGVSDDEEY